MEVISLQQNPGPATWNAILPTQERLPSLLDEETADWSIVGGAFAGLSDTRRLQVVTPNDRVVVLDAKALAERPARRNSRFMIDLQHDLAATITDDRLTKISQQFPKIVMPSLLPEIWSTHSTFRGSISPHWKN